MLGGTHTHLSRFRAVGVAGGRGEVGRLLAGLLHAIAYLFTCDALK